MVDFLRSLIPSFSHFQEYVISGSDGANIGFQSTLITKSNTPFAGGTGKSIEQARRICTAESIERVYFNRLFRSSETEKNKYLLSEYPTSCGFAAGFDNNNTIFRAVCEAIERWAWSKWIDNKMGLVQVKPNLETELSKYFSEQFDKVIFFQVPIILSGVNRPVFIGQNYRFSVAIGIRDNGIFPGSRVTTETDECWEHCLLEAWRHQVIFNNELRFSEATDIFDRRIQTYGRSGLETIKKLIDLSPVEFPAAKIRLLEEVASSNLGASDRFYVWRALCDDFVGWDRGHENRFIY